MVKIGVIIGVNQLIVIMTNPVIYLSVYLPSIAIIAIEKVSTGVTNQGNYFCYLNQIQYSMLPSKPLYQIQHQISYQRHLRRLQQIQQEKHKLLPSNDSSLKQMHRIRNKSARFRTIQHNQMLNNQNQRIINSILHIAKRKSQLSTIQPSMQYYNNRSRKQQERQIARTNHILAERILSKHSEFNPATLRKNINDYQQVKRRIEHNKRVSLPQLESLSRLSSHERQRKSRNELRNASVQ